MFRLIKKIIPKNFLKKILPTYHYLLAFFGALIYGFPSKKLFVIGVTGTKGKTTTSNLIAHILESAGHKTGLATTVNFKIGNKEWKNDLKQTMLGRMRLQKLLRQMVSENCEYAVVETSSEGILQFRHKFIDYKVAVFTNISPEHIERHGGFENYRTAKIKLFEEVAKKENGIGIYNLDDENCHFFLEPKIKNKFGFTFENKIDSEIEVVSANKISLSDNGISFEVNSEKFESLLFGKFNAQNILAAITVAKALKIDSEKIKEALKTFTGVSGRFEIIKENELTAIIDYAHEPASLEAVYKAIYETGIKKENGKLICLLGGQGGGRDKWKRAEMGKIANNYCDEIILANEDPYDENPVNILDDIKSGISENKFKNVFKIADRTEAIKKSVSLANKNDILIFTGKGGESSMCIKNGKQIPWDEKKTVLEIIKNKKPLQ